MPCWISTSTISLKGVSGPMVTGSVLMTSPTIVRMSSSPVSVVRLFRFVTSSTPPPRGPARGERGARGATVGHGVPWMAGGGDRVLRRPGGRQLEGLLDRSQGGVRALREGADGRAAGRAGARARAREGVPALSRRALQQGQGAVQDEHRGDGGRRRLSDAVGGRVRGRLGDVHDGPRPTGAVPPRRR